MLGTNEKWIDNQVGRYSVTRDGKVYSHRSGKKELSQSIHFCAKGNASLMVGIPNTTRYVRRLVAAAFLDNPDNHPIVLHKDGDPLNCDAENLIWTTNSHRLKRSWEERDTSGYKEKIKTRKLEESRAGISKSRHAIRITDKDPFVIRPDVEDRTEAVSIATKHGIPRQYVDGSLETVMSHGKRTIEEMWKFHKELFSLCLGTMSLSQIAKVVGVDPSYVSYVRNGKRLKNQFDLYRELQRLN